MSKVLRPSHPGKTLKSELVARGLTASRLAMHLQVPANRISQIIRGDRSITADTAIRLGIFFKNPPEFWFKLQTNYELAIARITHEATINRTVLRVA